MIIFLVSQVLNLPEQAVVLLFVAVYGGGIVGAVAGVWCLYHLVLKPLCPEDVIGGYDAHSKPDPGVIADYENWKQEHVPPVEQDEGVNKWPATPDIQTPRSESFVWC